MRTVRGRLKEASATGRFVILCDGRSYDHVIEDPMLSKVLADAFAAAGAHMDVSVTFNDDGEITSVMPEP
jgi:hypothetical protein